MAGVKAGCVHLGWVEGTTVWSHTASDTLTVGWSSISYYTWPLPLPLLYKTGKSRRWISPGYGDWEHVCFKLVSWLPTLQLAVNCQCDLTVVRVTRTCLTQWVDVRVQYHQLAAVTRCMRNWDTCMVTSRLVGLWHRRPVALWLTSTSTGHTHPVCIYLLYYICSYHISCWTLTIRSVKWMFNDK